jgi:hypothetical protein
MQQLIWRHHVPGNWLRIKRARWAHLGAFGGQGDTGALDAIHGLEDAHA